MLSITKQQVLTMTLHKGDIIGRKANSTKVNVDSNVRDLMIHLGIYLGNNKVLDLFQTGLREISLNDFTLENNGNNTFEVLRFRGLYKENILSQLMINLENQQFHFPFSSQPWNLLSNATNYESANCADFLHAQFIYAIQHLKENMNFENEQDRNTFLETYRNDKLIISENVTFPKYAIKVSNQFQSINGIKNNAFHNRFEDPKVNGKFVSFPFHSFQSYQRSKFFETVK